MHALVIAIGSHGDVHPMLGLARTLADRGHRVTFVTSGYFEDLARRAGLDDFVPLGTVEEFRESLANPDLWHPLRAFKVVFVDYVLPWTRQLYDIVTEHASPAGETIVVAPSLALGARLAQDKHGFPTATVHLAPGVFRTVHEVPVMGGAALRSWMPTWWKRGFWKLADFAMIERTLAPAVNEIRAEIGLPPAKGILDQWWHSPQLVIGMFPEWFGPRQPDWPKQVRLTGFPMYDERDVEPVSAELESFLAAGDKPIAFTPGSAMTFGQDFFRESVGACERLNHRGLLLSRHREHVPQNLPPSVQHFDYAPFSRVLPRCAALVHHGGVGSTAQALAAGIPQLVMPMAHDQYDNGARVARLGVGASIARRGYRAKRVAAKLGALIEDNTVASACRQVAARFVGVDALAETCELIEQLYESQQRQQSDPRGFAALRPGA